MFRNPVTDTVVVLVILLLFFGPKRLPGLARGLGEGIREFKVSITGSSESDEEADRPALAPTQGTGASAPAATEPTATPDR